MEIAGRVYDTRNTRLLDISSHDTFMRYLYSSFRQLINFRNVDSAVLLIEILIIIGLFYLSKYF